MSNTFHHIKPFNQVDWESIQKRFYSKVDKNGPILREELGPCWIWNAYKYPTGYGQFCFNGRDLRAHRVAWILENKIDLGQEDFICHKCDNRECVRLEHLYLGSRDSNTKDMVDRNRRKYEKAYQSKLDWQKVRIIRTILALKKPKDIAHIFNVSTETIKRINNNEQWRIEHEPNI